MTHEPVGLEQRVRSFVRQSRYGILSTVSVDVAGYPFGSVTPYVVTHEGCPVIFVSAIAQHTKNMKACTRVSLLVGDENADDKQAAGRVTIVGDATRVTGESLDAIQQRYLRCFPGHKEYEGAHAFSYYKIDPVRVRFIGGFGDINWIERDDWLLPSPEWAVDEARIVDHMNQDHADSLNAMCRHFIGIDSTDSELVSLDPEGFHIQAANDLHYLGFASICRTSEEIRTEMVRLARESQSAPA